MLILQALSSALFGIFRYSGRSDRLEQWTFAFFTAAMVVGIYLGTDNGFRLRGWILLATIGAGLWLLMAHISLFVRRLHDNDRSGLYMLAPFAAMSLVLIGWLGENGHIHFFRDFFLEYGWWIKRGGISACSLSGSFLMWIFLNEGLQEENRFGDPPL